MRHVVVAALLVAQCAARAAGQDDLRAGSGSRRPRPWQVLRDDAAWCGPRILYFFARHAGTDVSLDAVVQECQADPLGLVTLEALVSAAGRLGLEPRPVRATVEQLLELKGPAIACLETGHARTPPEAGSNRPLVHFVGIVPVDGVAMVVDPSRDAAPLAVDAGALARRYTGQAVLLKGCPAPLLRRQFLATVALGFVAGAGASYAVQRACGRRSSPG